LALLLPLVVACGDHEGAEGLDGGGSSAGGGSADGGAAGVSGNPELTALCDADCEAQQALDCVDPGTCQQRCRDVYRYAELAECEQQYLRVLQCVRDSLPQVYQCVDASSFGFVDGSPCPKDAAEVGDCIAR
jgi:hypothetical protein